MKQYILSDLYRYAGKTDFLTFFIFFFTRKSFRYLVFYRLCQTKIVILAKFFRMILKVIGRGSIQIPHTVKIGYGFYIGHNGPVVVNDSAVIGNNCTMMQFTTIGSEMGKAAVIGDNVYIGPNVCFVENVKVGNNVTIGAGSVVTKDIPDNATVAGNYAKVLHYKYPAQLLQRVWEL